MAKTHRKNWLQDSVMNLLVDYYPEVQFRPYGSGVTRENTLPWLKELGLGYVCIYAKGHSGYTSWDSSLKTRHTMLGQDMPRFFRDVTREAGTKLVLYYSGLLDGIAGERHPDWRMKNLDGTDKECFQDFKCFHSYGNCPLSGYFDEWVAVQLGELIANYDPDGFWFDGDWPGPCYCPRCQARFRQKTGWSGSWSDIIKRYGFQAAYKLVWNGIESEWRERCNAYIKKLKPDCLYSAGNVSPRREFLGPFDWRSGDFFSPGFFNLHDIARMMRWYSTLGVPFDAYVCDTSFTHVRKHVRSRSKTVERMMQEAATVATNGGAVGYWTYPNGNGAWVPSRMKKAVAVRRFVGEREDVFVHTTPHPETAIVVTDPATDTFGGGGVSGAHKAMASLHRSPVVMDESGLGTDFAYRVAVVPEQAVVAPAIARKLEAFARRGGLLLTTGATIQSPVIQRLLGVASVRQSAVLDGHVFLRDEHFGEPTGIDAPWDRLGLGVNAAKDGCASELYPLFLSWDAVNPELRNLPNNWPMHGQVDECNPEPAGCPAAVMRHVGKGCVVHIATSVFGQYNSVGDPQVLRWLREILETMDRKPFLTTDASSWVDVSLRRKDGALLVHFVNQNPGRDVAKLGTDDTWVDEIPKIGPFELTLRLSKEPAAARWEPGGARAHTCWRAEALTVTVPRFHIHQCLVVR